MLKILQINCKEFTFIKDKYINNETNPVEIYLFNKVNYDKKNIHLGLKFVFINSNQFKYLIIEMEWLIEYDDEFYNQNAKEINNEKVLIFPKLELIELLTTFVHNVIGFIVAKSHEYSIDMPLLQVDFNTMITEDIELN